MLLLARALDGATAAPTLAWRDEAGRVVASAAIPELARDLVLAPAGARYVVRTFESYDEEDAMDEDAASGPQRPRLMLGELGAAAARPRPIDGLAAGFVADDSLVVLVARGDSARARSLELQLSPLTAGPQGPTPAAPAWRLALPALLAPELRVNAATRHWSVTGRLASAARLAVTLEGTVGAPSYRQRGWAQAAKGQLDAAFGSVTPLGDGSALAVRLRGSYGAIPLLSLIGATPLTSELWRVDDARARRVAILPGFVRCAAGGGRVAAAACVTTDVRGRSRLDALDTAGVMQTLTSAAGPVSGLAVAPDGRVALAVAGRRELLLLDPSRHTATRLALPAAAGVAAEVQWTPAGDVAVIGYGERGTTVAVVK